MYTPNNIEFRIISSNAIAQYKLDQAFDFNELVNSEHFKFSSESREILLLNYDLWFKFINRIEKLFIKHDANLGINVCTVDAIVMLMDDTLSSIDDITSTHPLIFDASTKRVLDRSHIVFLSQLKKLLIDSENKHIYITYPIIVRYVSRCLHNLLFQLQECEHLIAKCPEPFISCTTECGDALFGIFPLMHRAKVYRDIFNIDEFIIKDYTDENCNISTELKKQLEIEGFKVSKILHVNK